jgi:protein SCO1/2
MNRVLLFWIATLLVFAGGMVLWTIVKHRDATGVTGSARVADNDVGKLPKSDKLTEFELVDQSGRRLNSHELDGHVWAGSFFFAACPSTCYNQNIKLQQLHAKYAEQGLRLVSITCDPSRDTPAALARYANRFDADPALWQFLTPAVADMEYIRRIANDFFEVAVGPETHTDRVVLFDRQGKMVGAYSVLNVQQFRELDQQIAQALAASAPETTVSAAADSNAVPAEVDTNSPK